MRLLFRLLPTVVAGVRLAWGVLAWGWVGCALLALLCALPWFELTVPGLWNWLAGLAFLLTITGVGPGYFAGRTQSAAWQRQLSSLTQMSRVFLRRTIKIAAAYYGIAYLLMLFTGAYGYILLIYPTGYLLQLPTPDQAIFERDRQQVVLRDKKMVVLRPLLLGLRFVTHLPDKALDSTWTVVTHPSQPLTYLPSDLARTQARLLAEARQARLDAAEEQRDQAKRQTYLAAQQATKQRLGYDVLHFELNENFFLPNKGRDLWQLREPLDSVRYGLARLGPTGTLRLTTNQISPGDDALRLAITQFKGTGTYWLRLPKAGADTSTLQLRRYTAGTGTTFASRPTKPARIEIIRFDPQQRVVEGTFAGRLFSPDGASLHVEEGSFSLRFTAPRPQPTLPH